MAEDDAAGDDAGPTAPPPADGSARTDDPVQSTVLGLAGSPGRTLAVGVAVLLALLYSVFIQQELLLVVWLLAVGFLVYLVWRFVRAHERIAAAAERVADD